jgi:Na+/pantothenate symporter
MEHFSTLFKQENSSELILFILMILYIILGLKTPEPIANIINTAFGKLFIFLIVLYLFLYANPILAILFLYVAFQLISKSNMNINTRAMQRFLPSESTKMSQFSAFNQFPYTLEQEVVKKMAPIVQSGSSLTPVSYSPLIDNIHDAAKI